MVGSTRTLTLFFTSRRVGAFPFLVAFVIGSSMRPLLSLRDIFCKPSPRVMIGTTISVPGKVWYCLNVSTVAETNRKMFTWKLNVYASTMLEKAVGKVSCWNVKHICVVTCLDPYYPVVQVQSMKANKSIHISCSRDIWRRWNCASIVFVRHEICHIPGEFTIICQNYPYEAYLKKHTR